MKNKNNQIVALLIKSRKASLSLFSKEKESVPCVDNNIENVISKFNNPKVLNDELQKYRKYNSSKAYNLICNSINAPKHKYRKLKFAVVSSIAFVAISFLLFTQYSENNTSQIIVSNDISISKPTLILSSGEDIDLTRLNKDIVIDNYIVEKLKTNELLYRKIENNNLISDVLVDTVIKYNTIIIPAKYTYDLVLEDGTQITLNAGSEFRFPVQFSKEKREVFLKGEAYFKVKKSSKPFIVKSYYADIMVYGTEFNVYTNKNKKQLEAVLISGSIGVTVDNREEIIMRPNTQLTYNETAGSLEIEYINSKDFILWKEGVFYYNNQRLKRVLSDISNWYGIEINFNENLKDILLSFNISKNTPIDDTIEFLQNIINKQIVKDKKGLYTIK